MKQIFSVMRFEFLSFAKSGSFIGMTIFMMAIALIGPAAPVIIGAISNVAPQRSIAVYDATGSFTAEDFAAALSPTAYFVNSADAARQAIADNTHNYAAVLRSGEFTLYVSAMGVAVGNIENQLFHLYRDAHRVQTFYDLGLTQQEVWDVLHFAPLSEIMTVGTVAGGTAVAEEATLMGYMQNFIYAYVLSFVLYMGLLMGGTYLLTTVVREKSTKTMELLITSCKPGRMLNGKVLGVGAAVLLKILLMVGAAVLSMTVVGIVSDGGALGEMLFTVELQTHLLILLAVFFLLGFVMYSYVYAALASTVSRMEDANSIATLPMMLIMVGFIGSIIAMQSPGAAWVAPLSHVPLFAPFIMFTRIVLGTASTVEVAVSIAAQIGTILLLAFLGAKIYRMGTLMYGNKPKLKDILAAFK
jgi:ABC-2 type transport system permease protein